ncbi:hypothetical protein [Hyphobacterium sp.]|uniref:hypothetical protein n=1 Tax=Hyphobacterium sp. TaxID=2004662 RepID=UPI003BAD3BD9
MSGGTTCPPAGSQRKATLMGLIVTILAAGGSAYAVNGLVHLLMELPALLNFPVRLVITLAAIAAGITLLGLYRRRPAPKIEGV